MDRLEAMRIFARVAERLSFSRAAEDLGLPRATVTDAVQRLERRLKVRLLDRTTRVVRPTPEGEAYHRRCLAILAAVEDAEGALAGGVPAGRLRVEVQGTLARHFLLPGLPEFLGTHPGIAFEMSEGDRLADPVREGIDVLLRTGDPGNESLVGRRIARLEQATLASPSYLAERGRPETPDDLRGGHRMVGFRASPGGGMLPLAFAVDGTIRELVLPAPVSVDAAESYVRAAEVGLGLIQVPLYHAGAALEFGILVRVLEGFPPPPLPVFLLHPRGRQLSPRVRAFLDWARHEFAARSDTGKTEGTPAADQPSARL